MSVRLRLPLAALAAVLAFLSAVLAFLAAPSAQAAPPNPLDRIAAAWRSDRIFVDEGLRAGFPQAELDRIRAELRTVDFPVYVALLPRTPSAREHGIDFPTLLQARVGEPGLYLIWTVSDEYWHGYQELFRPAGLKGRDLNSVRGADKQRLDIVNDRPAPMIVRTIQHAATAYDGRPLPAVPAGDLDPPSERSGRSTTDKENLSAYIGMGVGGLIGFVLTLFLVLRSRARRGKKAKRSDGSGDTPASVPAVQVQADRWIARAERALKSLESRRDKSVARLDRRDDASRRLEAAQTLRSSGPDDVLALAGAFVLARQAQHVASGNEVQPPCFFDPTHPSGTDLVAWSDDTEVPACKTCAKTVSRGKTPRGLRVSQRSGLLGRDRTLVPYWTLDPEDSPMVATGFGALTDDLADRVAPAPGDVR